MSESAIESIYLKLSKTKIGNARARNIDKVKLKVTRRDLPMRMLLPSTTGDLTFVSFGTLNSVDWVIRDLCLWAPLVSGTGVEKHVGSMVTYIKDYIAKLKTMRNPSAQSEIVGVAFAMGPVPWADEDYWAIDTTLTIREIL